MGSRSIQGKLWGQQPGDWAGIQEKTGEAGYKFVLDFLAVKAGEKILDIGCGSGYFSDLAQRQGADVNGIDATPELITAANQRNPEINFLLGEMEELPFNDNSFDVACGFNSFQYAANTKNALLEANRVLKPGGILVAMVWRNKEDCEAASYLKAVGSLMPPPPPGAPGPFALSENALLENLMKEVGLKIIENQDVDAIWEYPDAATAIKGLMSAGPVARAIENSGFEAAYHTVHEAVKPYTMDNGRVVYKNKFRVVIAKKD